MGASLLGKEACCELISFTSPLPFAWGSEAGTSGVHGQFGGGSIKKEVLGILVIGHGNTLNNFNLKLESQVISVATYVLQMLVLFLWAFFFFCTLVLL